MSYAWFHGIEERLAAVAQAIRTARNRGGHGVDMRRELRPDVAQLVAALRGVPLRAPINVSARVVVRSGAPGAIYREAVGMVGQVVAQRDEAMTKPGGIAAAIPPMRRLLVAFDAPPARWPEGLEGRLWIDEDDLDLEDTPSTR
jgi:hypothetical protein